MMTNVGYEEIKALVRMSGAGDQFVAAVAKATLSVVEGLRDAEIRAAVAEAALATELARLAAIRDVLAKDGGSENAPFSDTVREIATLLG